MLLPHNPSSHAVHLVNKFLNLRIVFFCFAPLKHTIYLQLSLIELRNKTFYVTYAICDLRSTATAHTGR